MTLKIRDEGDVIDANLRFHLAAGVDFFIIIDNGSVDETPEILERYRSAGLAQIIQKPADEFYRPNHEWVTDMARLAATEHEADWVVNNDADEFWWPLNGSIKLALEDIPARYLAVAAPRPEFVARPDGHGAVLRAHDDPRAPLDGATQARPPSRSRRSSRLRVRTA